VCIISNGVKRGGGVSWGTMSEDGCH